MEKTWDNIMSLLVSSNPQAFLDLVIPGCRFIRHHRNKLPSSGRQPDAVIETWGPIGDQFIFNGEFQTYKEDRIPERLLMYNVLLSQQHYPLLVRSFPFRLKIGKQGLAPCRERPWSSKVRKKEKQELYSDGS